MKEKVTMPGQSEELINRIWADESGKRYQISIARNFEQVEKLRPVWEKMQHNQDYPVLNADIDWYLSVLRSSKEQAEPYVILFCRDNEPTTMIIARLERHQLNCRIGYKVIFRPSLRCLTVVNGGILGDSDFSTCSCIINAFDSVLSMGDADMVWLSSVNAESALYRATKIHCSFVFRSHFLVIKPHMFMSIPDTPEQLYMRFSPKNRSNLQRLIRKLEKAYPCQVKIKCYSKEEELDEAIQAMATISSQTYQANLGSGFIDNAQARERLEFATERRWLRAYVLYMGDQPAAFELAIKYKKTYFGLSTGFDPKWRQDRIGTVLFLRFLESICYGPKSGYFDFGFGDAEYKRNYSDNQWPETSLYMFAPRLYPIAVNILQSAVTGLSLGLNRLLDKAGVTKWIKRRWRRIM